MSRFLPLLLMRAATIVVAGLLLFAVFGHAHAQDDNYGLKRFSGDNYDTLPAHPPGADAPQLPAASAQPYLAVPASGTPAYQPPATAMPYGYKQTMPVAPVSPVYPAQRMAATPADPYAHYRQPGAVDSDYVLGPGDKLKLNIFGEPDLSGEFTIDGAGFIRLPLAGDMRAAGYTAPQLEAAIANALSQGYLKSPRVAVEVSNYRPFYIIGAVNRPGQYAYVDHMNALNAVALAGGFTPAAVESVVFIRREGSNQEEEVPVDRTTVIHPGDVIKVHNTFFADAVSILSPFSGVAAAAATAAVIN
jgi:protein involved in polysaccharide export with SLBB domain